MTASKTAGRKAAKKKTAGKTAAKTTRKTMTKKSSAKKTKATRPPATGQTPPSAQITERNAEEYKKALSAYATGLELLQQKDWRGASRALAEFVADHTKERELSERARMYLRICAQHLDSNSLQPETFEDRCYLAVLQANKGDYKEALENLEQALEEQPGSEKAFYLKASTLALKGDRAAALQALGRSIALDEQNRIYAANNPDFNALHDDEEFITLTTREDEDYS